MADLKVTKMVIKVDLQCSKCYRKIKKVLCRYPQIRDQVYDEKQNTVTITVVCCSPENIKEKIACKAGDTVESIEFVPDKPKEPEKKDPPKPADKPKVVFIEPPKEAAKPPAPAPAPVPKAPAPTPAPAPAPAPKKPPAPAPTPTPAPAPAPAPAPKAPTPAPTPKAPAPTPAPVPPPKAPEPTPIPPPVLPVPVVPGFPPPPPQGPVLMYPVGVCCCCYEGGPCYDGCGRTAYEYSGGNRGYYVSRCDEYFSEENASGCSVM